MCKTFWLWKGGDCLKDSKDMHYLNMPTLVVAYGSFRQELKWDRDHYFIFDIHTATYVGSYTWALYSPSPGPGTGPVQALSEWAIIHTVRQRTKTGKGNGIGTIGKNGPFAASYQYMILYFPFGPSTGLGPTPALMQCEYTILLSKVIQEAVLLLSDDVSVVPQVAMTLRLKSGGFQTEVWRSHSQNQRPN